MTFRVGNTEITIERRYRRTRRNRRLVTPVITPAPLYIAPPRHSVSIGACIAVVVAVAAASTALAQLVCR